MIVWVEPYGFSLNLGTLGLCCVWLAVYGQHADQGHRSQLYDTLNPSVKALGCLNVPFH